MESSKRKVTVTVDSGLLEAIERHTAGQIASSPANRSAMFEKALRLLRQQQIDEQIRKFYQNRPQVDIELEEETAVVQQEQLEEIWDDL